MTRSLDPAARPRAVIFDLGGVLIDWNPRYLYRTIFRGDEAAMERFLSDVCSPEWNARQDAGRPLAEAVETLARERPDQRSLIEAYYGRWDEMLGGPIDGTVAILDELRARRVPVYALSNWSAETFPIARARYDFLGWFDGLLVSGEVGLAKPDERIFELFLERNGLSARTAAYVDDSPANVDAARRLGFQAILFDDPARLRGDLVALGLLA